MRSVSRMRMRKQERPLARRTSVRARGAAGWRLLCSACRVRMSAAWRQTWVGGHALQSRRGCAVPTGVGWVVPTGVGCALRMARGPKDTAPMMRIGAQARVRMGRDGRACLADGGDSMPAHAHGGAAHRHAPWHASRPAQHCWRAFSSALLLLLGLCLKCSAARSRGGIVCEQVA
jgi:hypothetical protein